MALFPAYAGVILMQHTRLNRWQAFPRVCGGDPERVVIEEVTYDFSPRMRG